MSKKQPRIPGMRENTANREQRRHPERVEDTPLARDVAVPEPADVEDPRAKNSGHKTKTADKWNQGIRTFKRDKTGGAGPSQGD